MKFCKKCEALGETCCEASAARRATANALARLVERQDATIKGLRAALEVSRRLTADLMAKGAVS